MEHGGKWLERSVRRSVAVIVVFSLILGMLPLRAASVSRAAEGQSRSSSLRNPRVSGGVTTWDCIYFGRYWQNDTNGDGKADRDDVKEVIKWRVLSVDGDDAFLVADRNLDCQPYNDTSEDVTWETSTLREWLNDSFLNNAFSASEQSAIKNSRVINSDSADYGTEGGSDTTDQVYLLSVDEVTNGDYGFSVSIAEKAKSRRALNTAYAKKRGAYTNTGAEYEGNSYWWLRSPGRFSFYAAYVTDDGSVYRHGNNVINNYVAVRPALHLNLSSVSEWSLAGTVASDGTVIPPNPDIPSAINPDIISKKDDSGGEKQSVSKREVTPGKIVTVSGLQYKVKKSAPKERTVVLWKVSNKKLKKANIPNSIKIQSASYKVVEISKNAFKGCKQLQTATIGKEVRIIGNGAFSGCKKIKKVMIRSKVLKKIGKGAFTGVSRKAKIQVPKSKVAQYRKLMKKG